MTEHRFRSPEGIEWVTTGTPSKDVLDQYPAGTVEIPMVPIELPTLPQIKAGLRATIDSSAEAERRKYITAGSGQAMTYMQKADEAARYLAVVAKGDTPNPDDYPLLSAEVGITAPALGDVAGVVSIAFTQWQVIGGMIEAARLSTKAAIDQAETVEAAQAAADSVIWPNT